MYTKKNFLILLLLSTCFHAFAQKKHKNHLPKINKPEIVGGDKDKHGCIPSAGYTYSIVKKECIRVFEQTVQLKEVDNKKSYSSNTAVVFNNDSSKVEIFLAELSKSIILNRVSKKPIYVWQKDKYNLIYHDNIFQLSINKVLKFASN